MIERSAISSSLISTIICMTIQLARCLRFIRHNCTFCTRKHRTTTVSPIVTYTIRKIYQLVVTCYFILKTRDNFLMTSSTRSFLRNIIHSRDSTSIRLEIFSSEQILHIDISNFSTTILVSFLFENSTQELFVA